MDMTRLRTRISRLVALIGLVALGPLLFGSSAAARAVGASACESATDAGCIWYIVIDDLVVADEDEDRECKEDPEPFVCQSCDLDPEDTCRQNLPDGGPPSHSLSNYDEQVNR